VDAKRQWIVVTALIGLAILVAGFMFVVRPQYHKTSALNKDAKAVAVQTATLRTKLASLQSEQKQLKDKQADLLKLTTQVPPTVSLADLTSQLQAAAQNLPTIPTSGNTPSNDASVDLSVLSPGAPAALSASVTSGSTSTTATSTTATTSTTGPAQVQQIPLSMTVSGTYFNLESFLDRLETMKRAIIVDGFNITYQGTAQEPLEPNSGQLTVTITARAFMTTASLTPSAAQ
jgi:Tfp pilus assembly protein PilO